VILNGQGGSVVEASGTPTAAAGAEPCTTVTVLSSFENSEMVSRLVEGYNAQPRDVNGTCVTVVATRDKSGLAAEDATPLMVRVMSMTLRASSRAEPIRRRG
jgi:hypothetical protein